MAIKLSSNITTIWINKIVLFFHSLDTLATIKHVFIKNHNNEEKKKIRAYIKFKSSLFNDITFIGSLMNVRWLVDRMVVLSVYNNFLKDVKLHFHAPIEAT